MGIVEKGYRQRIADLESIATRALEALAIIALSYKYRIGKDDQEPCNFAQDALEALNVDLELIKPHLEQAMEYLGWKDG